MKVTTATRRSLKRKIVERSLFKVLCYVLTCFMSEKGTTSVDLLVDCKLDLDSSTGIYSKVKEPVFVPGTSCCTTISFSHLPHEYLVFIVGFSNSKG